MSMKRLEKPEYKVNKGFWAELPKPFFALAPMDGVTDLPFRLITKRCGNPDFVVTEFVPVEALIRGIERAFIDLRYEERERPILAQLYGHEPELFYYCAQIIAELGFDGIDINMGCPARKIEQRGAGAGLIRTPEIAVEIIDSVKAGLEAWVENGIEWDKFPKEAKTGRLRKRLEEFRNDFDKTHENDTREVIPLSVKTRIGYDEPDIENWFGILAKLKLTAIAIHGRTLKQAYRGKADWEQIERACKLIKSIAPGTLVIGNGDITERKMGREYAQKYKVDGIMIARSAIGNPWAFSELDKPEGEELFKVMLEHAKMHYQYKDPRAFVQMRRVLSDYIKGMEGAKELRSKLVRVNSPEEVDKLLFL
ncbi:hypothetical protein GF389_01000 [Candidatus Dojkabacteria bacterium]|nr:hypothetical protein [Candidatus Dojkabacteria bacterium]